MSTERLLQIGVSARRFLEPCWMTTQGEHEDRIFDPVSSGMCRYTAEFLARNAAALGLDGWAVHGGPGGWTGGAEPAIHFWLSDGVRILDLTADQFGADIPPVLLTTVGDPRYAAIGPAAPLTDTAAGMVDGTRWWDDSWHGGRSDQVFTPIRLAHHLGPSSLAFAVMLADAANLQVFRLNGPGAPRYAAGSHDAGPDWDAAGLLEAGTPGALVPDAELAALRVAIPEEDLEAAIDFASRHPRLNDLMRQASYALYEEARAACEAGDDGAGIELTPLVR